MVVYAVGGPQHGPAAFQAGVELLAAGGLFHLVGLYERNGENQLGANLPLNGSSMMGKRLIGGCIWSEVDMPAASARALELLASGQVG